MTKKHVSFAYDKLMSQIIKKKEKISRNYNKHNDLNKLNKSCR